MVVVMAAAMAVAMAAAMAVKYRRLACLGGPSGTQECHAEQQT